MNESRRSRFRFDLITLAAIAVGLLFWARLIIVTDMPRLAIAGDTGMDVTPAPAASDNADVTPDAHEIGLASDAD